MREFIDVSVRMSKDDLDEAVRDWIHKQGLHTSDPRFQVVIERFTENTPPYAIVNGVVHYNKLVEGSSPDA